MKMTFKKKKIENVDHFIKMIHISKNIKMINDKLLN